MPDLISHIGFGYLVGARYKSRGWMALFLMATILPDVVTRTVYIVFPSMYWFIKPLHTPLGIFLLALLLSGIFEKKIQIKPSPIYFQEACCICFWTYCKSMNMVAILCFFPLAGIRMNLGSFGRAIPFILHPCGAWLFFSLCYGEANLARKHRPSLRRGNRRHPLDRPAYSYLHLDVKSILTISVRAIVPEIVGFSSYKSRYS